MKEIRLNEKFSTMVDDEDYDFLMKYNWCLSGIKNHPRPRAKINGKYQLMSRIIMGVTDPKIFVDHKDRNTLNNQRSNLRIATQQENNWNSTKQPNCSSKYKGVHFILRRKKWVATVMTNGKSKYLGSFNCEHTAAHFVNIETIKQRGDFACLNILPEGFVPGDRLRKTKAPPKDTVRKKRAANKPVKVVREKVEKKKGRETISQKKFNSYYFLGMY